MLNWLRLQLLLWMLVLLYLMIHILHWESSFVEKIPSTNKHQNSDGELKLLEEGTSPVDLSLFYQDPQGEIQGPFLGVDIVSWLDQGFFGTDLPVRLADAAEGTPFQPLGEVMSLLKVIAQSMLGICSAEPLDTASSNLDVYIPSITNSSFIINDKQWTESWDVSGNNTKCDAVQCEASIHPCYSSLLTSHSETSIIPTGVEGKSFHCFAGQDSEEVLYKGMSVCSMEEQVEMLANDSIALPTSSSGQHFCCP